MMFHVEVFKIPTHHYVSINHIKQKIFDDFARNVYVTEILLRSDADASKSRVIMYHNAISLIMLNDPAFTINDDN